MRTETEKKGIPAYPLWMAACAAIVALMAYVRLVLYPTEIVPLTYALPLLLCLIHRDLRLHWAMALSFVALVLVKMLMVLPKSELDGVTRGVFLAMQFANILVPAAVLHMVVVLNGRLRKAIDSLEVANSELEASNEELAAREEEISQQNEELQTQAEELEQQTEELSAQTEDLQTLNEQLAMRERTLADLIDVSMVGASEQETLEKLGGAISKLFANRADGAAVLEASGTEMRVLPLFGMHGGAEVLRRDRTLADLVATRDRAGFLPDINLRPDLDVPKLAEGKRVRSLLAAPLRADVLGPGYSAGALEVYSDQPGEWSEEELRMAQWAAEQLGRTWATSRLREELDSRQRLLRAVTDASSVALFMLDDRGECTYANPAATSTTGFSGPDLLGSSLKDALKLEADSWQSGEYELTRKAGGRFAAACTSTVVPREGAKSGLLLEIVDVSGQKQIASERERLLESERAARATAEQANRAKDEFVATLSHELRTPLNAVLGWATILRKGGEDKEATAKGLEIIERNARLQGQLISDLLDMSKIAAGKVRLDVQTVDLLLVIEAALDAVRPAADAKGVRLEKVLEPVDRIVSGDPSRLQQVVWNLLTNAVKFTSSKGSVRVTLSRVASYVQIVVSDTGQGIDPNIIGHIFERYRQGDASTSRHQGGLGLGLSIVKHLVELHGGTVHAQSEGVGRGSAFSVLLPVRAVETRPAAAHEPHPTAPAALPLSDESPTLKGLSILVVDDDADARELVARVLSDRGASVTAVENGENALLAMGATKFDMLVSDIGMPGMDGYTLIQRVRAEPGRSASELPAIALTAFARSEDRTRALLAGFQSHISKPVEGMELVATVASVRPAPRSDVRV